jgi:hypothetical protein
MSTFSFIEQTLLDKKSNSKIPKQSYWVIPQSHQQICGTDKKKFYKETSELNNTIYQMTLTNILRIFPLTAVENSAVHGTFSKIDHI